MLLKYIFFPVQGLRKQLKESQIALTFENKQVYFLSFFQRVCASFQRITRYLFVIVHALLQASRSRLQKHDSVSSCEGEEHEDESKSEKSTRGTSKVWSLRFFLHLIDIMMRTAHHLLVSSVCPFFLIFVVSLCYNIGCCMLFNIPIMLIFLDDEQSISNTAARLPPRFT